MHAKRGWPPRLLRSLGTAGPARHVRAACRPPPACRRHTHKPWVKELLALLPELSDAMTEDHSHVSGALPSAVVARRGARLRCSAAWSSQAQHAQKLNQTSKPSCWLLQVFVRRSQPC